MSLRSSPAAPRRVSIFMNVFDCHVNRYPAEGTVAYRHYNRRQVRPRRPPKSRASTTNSLPSD